MLNVFLMWLIFVLLLLQTMQHRHRCCFAFFFLQRINFRFEMRVARVTVHGSHTGQTGWLHNSRISNFNGFWRFLFLTKIDTLKNWIDWRLDSESHSEQWRTKKKCFQNHQTMMNLMLASSAADAIFKKKQFVFHHGKCLFFNCVDKMTLVHMILFSNFRNILFFWVSIPESTQMKNFYQTVICIFLATGSVERTVFLNQNKSMVKRQMARTIQFLVLQTLFMLVPQGRKMGEKSFLTRVRKNLPIQLEKFHVCQFD